MGIHSVPHSPSALAHPTPPGSPSPPGGCPRPPPVPPPRGRHSTQTWRHPPGPPVHSRTIQASRSLSDPKVTSPSLLPHSCHPFVVFLLCAQTSSTSVPPIASTYLTSSLPSRICQYQLAQLSATPRFFSLPGHQTNLGMCEGQPFRWCSNPTYACVPGSSDVEQLCHVSQRGSCTLLLSPTHDAMRTVSAGLDQDCAASRGSHPLVSC